jgi:hypothetical protein
MGVDCRAALGRAGDNDEVAINTTMAMVFGFLLIPRLRKTSILKDRIATCTSFQPWNTMSKQWTVGRGVWDCQR